MRTLPMVVILAAAGLTFACAGVPEPSSVSSPAPAVADLERLISARTDSGGLRVRAASRGCTSKESFDVIVERARGEGGLFYEASLVRKGTEACSGDPVPNGVALFYTRGELGLPPGAQLSVRNPIGVN